MKLIQQIGAALLLFITSVSYGQWAEMPMTGLSGSITHSQRGIQQQLDGTTEVTLAMTDDGLFKYNPGSQIWTRYGSGLEGVRVQSVSFGPLGKYIVSGTFRNGLNQLQGGLLYKYDENAQTWDTIVYDIPLTPHDLGVVGSVRGQVFQYSMKGKTRVFLSRFGDTQDDTVADTTFGIVYSDDEGLTWNNYLKFAVAEGEEGLRREGSGNSSRLTTSFYTIDSQGRIFMYGKNYIYVSTNGGDTWINRRGNYVMSNSSNYRTMLVREFNGVEYLCVGTDITSGGHWSFGKTVINDSLSNPWTGSNIGGEVRSIADFTEAYLFARTDHTLPRLSYDNGASWEFFGENLPLVNNDNRIQGMSRAGDSLYVVMATNHTTHPGKVFVFDLTTLNAPKLTFSIKNASNTAVAGAVVEFNGRVLSTNAQGLVTVYGIKDSTDAPLKITKEGYIPMDTTISFNTGAPLNITFRAKMNQMIDIGSFNEEVLSTDAPFTVSATSTSGLPVTISIFSGPATFNATTNTVTLTGEPGTIIFKAVQAGNASYHPADETNFSIVVTAPLSFAGNTAKETMLFPNPAVDKITLPLGANNPLVMSASGAPMDVRVTGRNIEVSGLNPGLYFVRTSAGTFKFMKK